jgi:membrane protein implicated in regulation of membrane protease activity
MVLVMLLLLILLAAMGVLGFMLKLAVAVALGMVLGVVIIGYLVTWRVRRALFGRKPRPRWRQIPGSRVEVLDRHR